ncbi:MAG: hypothetical protein U1F45_18350 [Burkholderiales bacterium]
MKHTTRLAVAMLALAPALASGEELDLGQVLDKGAVKLGKADLEGLIPGSTTKFSQWTTGPRGQANVEYSWENPPDGASFRAYGRGQQTSFDGTGTWSISRDGRYCWDITFTRQWKTCRFVFKAGDGYYLSPAADDRAAKALSVKFSK